MNKKKIALSAFISGALVLFMGIFFTVAHFTFRYYEKEKIFQNGGLTIALTRDFQEKETVEYTAHYSSDKMMVLLLRVEFDGFDMNKWNPYERSNFDYAEMMSNEYKKLYPSTTEVVVKEELVYFTFDFEKNGKEYKYLLATYKANDAYWEVSFGCEKRNYDALQNNMIDYAQSVSVGV